MKKCMLLLALLVAVASANAGEVIVGDTSDALDYTVISTSQTWTSDNVYRLAEQIYIDAGATLTIEPGTLIQSQAGLGGSLAICRGAKIYAKGTACNPIIFTSTNDDLQNWHEGAEEWGNLTIMGNAYTSTKESDDVATFDADNDMQMEGLYPIEGEEHLTLFGGDNDNDNSGVISYVSLRYGGKVIGQADELNGMSLGAIGRGTDIHHVEIMNNVDDGIEIWGGTVNLKYVNIWNIGDDSFDLDTGWRGKAQFGLIVQGYSVDAAQGSGVGDNIFEMDGAENDEHQPVTTAAIYNFTVVGQPIDGDYLTDYKDNAHVQFRNCVFMNVGDAVVHTNGDYTYVPFEDAAGDVWDTAYSATYAGTWPNQGTLTTAFLEAAYQSQVDGYLCEMSDNVFYNNVHADAYTTATSVGVFDAGMNNVQILDTTGDKMPIQSLTRGAAFTTSGEGKVIYPVTHINPCAANDAVASVGLAPLDGFFTPVKFRGAFPSNYNWLAGWTAVDAYGMTDTSMNTGSCKEGDINQDGSVDLADFTRLANNWLN